jgi:hypothetical protein
VAVELQRLSWDGRGDSAPLTWDYAKRLRRKAPYDRDMAMTTCANGHTLRMSSDIHKIAPDGTVTPSYVCTHPECSFHQMVRLIGWDPSHVFEYCQEDP